MEYKDTLKINQGESIKSVSLISNVTQITTYKYVGNEAQKIENQLSYDEAKQEIDMSMVDFLAPKVLDALIVGLEAQGYKKI